LKEVDDSIKIIAGGLIKAAAEAGANHLDLWPADIDSKLYADIPVSAKAVDWAKEFHRWLISLENKFIPPKAFVTPNCHPKLSSQIDSS